jgi:hypothetical protein
MQVLSKFVGESEQNIRNLFQEADAEYKAKVRGVLVSGLACASETSWSIVSADLRCCHLCASSSAELRQMSCICICLLNG